MLPNPRVAMVVDVRLPEASASELGLPSRDGGYRLRPVLDQEGNTVLVPEIVSYRVLARWVRPWPDSAEPEQMRPGTVNVP